jgi:hypothetical protein
MGIQCKTVEQLAVVLTRAGLASLRLEVFWPVAEGTLELISSRKCPIRSLKIFNVASNPFTISSFQGFNLGALRELEFYKVPWDLSGHIMDLALQSDYRGMKLELIDGQPSLDLFKHRLLEQVAEIRVSICKFLLSVIMVHSDVRYSRSCCRDSTKAICIKGHIVPKHS